MGIVKRIIDQLAKEVQKTTGESDRREKVARLKELAVDYKEKVTAAILRLNEYIHVFNTSIHKLNYLRNTTLKENIDNLALFLCKFGSCKKAGAYAQEQDKLPAEFPNQELYKIEDYIGDVDWSQDDVFLNTFMLSPIGMKIKTRKQNLSLQEHINELIIQTESTITELNTRQYSTLLETQICDLYISNIQIISDVITQKILPEMELVEAFFQAEKIKNEILCDHELHNLTFSYNLRSIINTPYHKHFQFVKNAVAFYVISCKIYNTPVLSNLLCNCTTETDLEQLKGERKVLHANAKILNDSMSVRRGVVINAKHTYL